MKEKPIEIVKRIPTPNEDPEKLHEDEIIFEEHLLYEEEYQKSNNKFILILFTLSAISILGFYSFYFLDKKESIDSSIKIIASLENTTQIESTTPKLKPTRYTEILALPTLMDNNQSINQKVITEPTVKKIKKPILKSTTPLNIIETVHRKPTNNKEVIIKPTVGKIKKPILALTTPLNIREIIHKKPMTVEEYDAQEKAKKEAQLIEYITPKKQQAIYYETLKPRYYTIREKDTLATISKMFYGNNLEYTRIIRANKRLRNAKTSLRLGEKICIPRKDGKTTKRFIIVEKDNTLALLAKRFYGDRSKIKKIIRANYKIKNSRSTLQIGQKVYLPQ